MTKQLTEDLLQSIIKLQRSIIHRSKKIAAEHDLSMPQFLVLTMLRHKGALPQKFIQKKSRLPKSTLSYVIDGLVNEGIVSRSVAKDNRRESMIILTDRGNQLLRTIREDDRSAETKLSQAIKHIGPDEIHKLIDLHDVLIQSLEEVGDNQ